MRLRFQLCFLCLFSVLLLPASVSAEKLLRWKLVPGQSLQVTLNQDIEMTTSIMGNDMQSAADVGMTLIWSVADVDPNGLAKINQSIDRLTMKMSTPGNAPLEYDSSAPIPTDAISKQLAESVEPIVGTRFKQQMTNRGELVEMWRTEEDVASPQAAGAQIKNTFSHAGLKSLLEQAAAVLPQQPVKPGDTWEGSSEINSPAGTLNMHTKYIYRGSEVQDGRALERIDLEITVGFADGPNAMGLDVKVSDQKNSGTMYFDAAIGQFVRSEVIQGMTMETQLGEQVHRQQLNTRLRMTVSEPPQVADRAGAMKR